MQATRGTSLSPATPAAPGRSAASRHRLLFLGVALTSYAVDLVTKLLAAAHLDPQRPVEVVGSLLRLQLVRNPGAAFGTGTSYTIVLTFIALAAAVTVVRFGRRLGDGLWALALGFLLAGVCGNLTDRVFRQPGVFRGHVVDFLELPHWPVFNVADMLIDVGVALILVQTFRGVPITGRRAADPEAPAPEGTP